MRSSTWRQLSDKWSSSVIKMPPKPKGKKSQSSAKSSMAKNAQQKKKPTPKKLPEKTRSPAIKMPVTAGTKRRQTENSGDPCEKRSKTCPLTAADILDIVSAVVKAMPQPAEASAISTPQRRSSRCKQKNTDQLSQATRRHITGMTLSTEAEDNSDDGDADNEDFGKLGSSACSVSFSFKKNFI